MHATLTTVTIISLLLAWAMALIAWQRIRTERRRSDARLATLRAEIGRRPDRRQAVAARAIRREPLPPDVGQRAAFPGEPPGPPVRPRSIDAPTALPPRSLRRGTARAPAGRAGRQARQPSPDGSAWRPADPAAERAVPRRRRPAEPPEFRVRGTADGTARAHGDDWRASPRPPTHSEPHLPFDARAGREDIRPRDGEGRRPWNDARPESDDVRSRDGGDGRRHRWNGRPESDDVPYWDDGDERQHRGNDARPESADVPYWTGRGTRASGRDAARREVRRGLAARALSYFWRAALAPAPTARRHWGHHAAAVLVAAVLVAGVSLAERTPLDLVGRGLPVELLSLGHRRQGDYLAVSGSIRNPRGGKGREKLSVRATVFDRTGAIVGTGQTPLPVEGLPPGGETPFTISLPDADLIDRYRVSFMEDGSKLPHVDRRGPDAAAPTPPTGL